MWDRLKRLFSGSAKSPRRSAAQFNTRRGNQSDERVLPYWSQRTPLADSAEARFSYLGNGVSHEAADLATDAELLKKLELPVVETGNQLAEAIGFSPKRLKRLAVHSAQTRSCNYFYFTVPKRSGGERLLAAPRPQIDACCRWILREILDKISIHPAAHGFAKGKSIKSNAEIHTQQQVIVNLDLLDFFPAIEFRRVRGLFESLGYNGQIATLLALLTTEASREPVPSPAGTLWAATGPRHLPQGACSSPSISNLICRALDRRLSGLCRSLSWNYSRYADDLTFSASAVAGQRVGYMLHRIRGIVREEGFQVNESKTRVQRPSQAQTVTGLVVNDGVSVSRSTVRMLRAILHNASLHGLESQNRDNHPHFAAWLEGMIGHVVNVDPQHGVKLQRQFRQLKKQQVSHNHE
ncbi:MAG TPA: RNA-directed DNA polymerase [Planctomycetaceae bacterium]|nr:RNA-directed DNA polymerase [Planctomycetaceae bacterium]